MHYGTFRYDLGRYYTYLPYLSSEFSYLPRYLPFHGKETKSILA